VTRRIALLAAAVLLAACASPSRGDWRYSQVTAAVDRYRRGHTESVGAIPLNIRSIRVDGANRLTVYLSDSPGLKGKALELKLSREPDGSWTVTGTRLFEY
jgi:hypothetical protein